MTLGRCSAVAGVAALIGAIASSAAANSTPRLQGTFPTVLRITKVVGAPDVAAGNVGTARWTFRPDCRAGACATALQRPERQAGSTAVYVHTLTPISPVEYRGHSKTVLTACVFPNGKRFAGGYRTTQTIDVHVIAAKKGRVVAYSGTQDTRGTATALGREHGCPSAREQYASFKSAGRD
jgi:hypothetical protein